MAKYGGDNRIISIHYDKLPQFTGEIEDFHAKN